MGFLFLVAVSRGYYLVVVCKLLIVVASIVMEQGIQGAQASVGTGDPGCPGFGSCSKWAQ